MPIIDTDDLVGLAEVAEILQVSTRYAYELTTKKGFPDPALELSAGRMWDKWEVQEWATAHRRNFRQVGGGVVKKGPPSSKEDRGTASDYYPPFDPQRRERAKRALGITEPERQTDQKEGTDEL